MLATPLSGEIPVITGTVSSRAVVVIDPVGRIADVMPTFNPVDPQAYERLEQVIDRVSPEPHGEQQ